MVNVMAAHRYPMVKSLVITQHAIPRCTRHADSIDAMIVTGVSSIEVWESEQ